MAKFDFWKDGAKVRVMAGAEHSELVGKTGKIVRLKIGNRSAWVRMDEPLPEHLASFIVGDSRRNDIVLWPEDCEPCGKR